MPGAEYGFRRAIIPGVTGLIVASIIISILKSVGQESFATSVLVILTISGASAFVSKIKYWSTPYLMGYLGGYILLGISNVFGFWEFMLFSFVPLAVLIGRISRRAGYE